ncbi:MAG: AbrB family transcriptional regulator [Solirubrobacteraceae bacterium]
MRRATPWVLLVAATVAAGRGLGVLGLPSPYLFAALLVGIAVALTRPDAAAVPDGVFTAAQAVTGVVLGAYLQSSSVSALGSQWLPVTLVSAGTLVVSLAAGALLARTTEVDEPTAALGLVAGGASGIVGMARELGADDRLVAFMQYLRVLVVVLLTPLLVAIAFPGTGAGGLHAAADPVLGTARGWLLTLAIAPLGALLAARLRVPAASLMGPMIVSGIVTLAIPGGGFAVPALLREAGFIAIGLQVGLRFTMGTVRQVGRLLVPVLLTLAGLLLACFGLAVALAASTSVSLLDAYLATTPGGLYAVLAVAVGAGANTTFIVAVQGLRLLIMVLLAPAAVRLLVGRPARLAA